MDDVRGSAPQRERHVQSYLGLDQTDLRPGKHRVGKVDGSGNERMDRIGRIYAPTLLWIEPPHMGSDPQNERRAEASVARPVRIHRCRTPDRLADTDAVEPRRLRHRTHIDVAQALAICNLNEGDKVPLLYARQRTRTVIAAVTVHDAAKVLSLNRVHRMPKRRRLYIRAFFQTRKSSGVGCHGQCNSSGERFGTLGTP